MTMHEVCTRLSLTKKAVRYYIGEGLVAPRRLENGYHDFSEDDLKMLERIALLRQLDLSINEIRRFLSGDALSSIFRQKKKQLAHRQNALVLLREFSTQNDWTQLKRRLEGEERRRTLAERLEIAFPGGFGRLIACQFAPYLSEPLQTPEQQSAFDEIIAFLDSVAPLDPALISHMNAALDPIDAKTAEKMRQAKENMLDDPAAWLHQNGDLIAQYVACKQTEDYRLSPAGQLESTLKALCRESGYNERFLPTLRCLSPAYNAYYERLCAANELFTQSLSTLNSSLKR